MDKPKSALTLLVMAHPVTVSPMPGNGTGVQQGQGNATYGSSRWGVEGRHGRDGQTVKSLCCMPKGGKVEK